MSISYFFDCFVEKCYIFFPDAYCLVCEATAFCGISWHFIIAFVLLHTRFCWTLSNGIITNDGALASNKRMTKLVRSFSPQRGVKTINRPLISFTQKSDDDEEKKLHHGNDYWNQNKHNHVLADVCLAFRYSAVDGIVSASCFPFIVTSLVNSSAIHFQCELSMCKTATCISIETSIFRTELTIYTTDQHLVEYCSAREPSFHVNRSLPIIPPKTVQRHFLRKISWIFGQKTLRSTIQGTQIKQITANIKVPSSRIKLESNSKLAFWHVWYYGYLCIFNTNRSQSIRWVWSENFCTFISTEPEPERKIGEPTEKPNNFGRSHWWFFNNHALEYRMNK